MKPIVTLDVGQEWPAATGGATVTPSDPMHASDQHRDGARSSFDRRNPQAGHCGCSHGGRDFRRAATIYYHCSRAKGKWGCMIFNTQWWPGRCQRTL